ncbi:DUF2798 domain-containing protein [Oceanobacillus sp. CF4.6]|uniref:DUF2798 domain-containing protein n=1 Tax=Oceanobacillus sp. CF4.6 TaxID=3373080 RepID=UPI003EE6ECBF
MSFSMSLFISFIMVSINVDYNSLFLQERLKTLGMAFMIAYFGAYFFPREHRRQSIFFQNQITI